MSITTATVSRRALFSGAFAGLAVVALPVWAKAIEPKIETVKWIKRITVRMVEDGPTWNFQMYDADTGERIRPSKMTRTQITEFNESNEIVEVKFAKWREIPDQDSLTLVSNLNKVRSSCSV
jgi:hypothetical protein